MAMAKDTMIWVVDGDPELRKMVGNYLIDQGYDVRSLCDVKQFEARLECQRPDLVVLDLMLPGDDGLTALRRLRDAGDDLPVVMLTARADGVDRIIGLEQGADDYLAKPFLPRELTARIEAVLRRRNGMPAGIPVEGGGCIRFGDNQLDLSARTLLQNNEPVVITSGEFSLLAAFVRHPHRPLSRERLIELARRSRQRHRQPQHGRSGVAGAQACGTGSDPPPLRADGLGVWLRVCSGRHAEIPLTCLANGD